MKEFIKKNDKWFIGVFVYRWNLIVSFASCNYQNITVDQIKNAVKFLCYKKS